MQVWSKSCSEVWFIGIMTTVHTLRKSKSDWKNRQNIMTRRWNIIFWTKSFCWIGSLIFVIKINVFQIPSFIINFYLYRYALRLKKDIACLNFICTKSKQGFRIKIKPWYFFTFLRYICPTLNFRTTKNPFKEGFIPSISFPHYS